LGLKEDTHLYMHLHEVSDDPFQPLLYHQEEEQWLIISQGLNLQLSSQRDLVIGERPQGRLLAL
jgi:hypothetical protein